MSLANPFALFLLSLAIPIVVFYILKVRLRRMPVSTIIFWQQLFDEKKPRSIWQRLRHLLSLLLQLLMLLLLILALTEPFFSWETRAARRIVLVIDNSASMNAMDGLSTRLEQAQTKALEQIARLRHNDQMAIIIAGTEPKIVCGLTGYQRTLRDTVNAISPSDGPTRIDEALSLAQGLVAGQENGEVQIISDGCGQTSRDRQGADFNYIPVGTKLDNVGITQFQVRRSLVDPIGYELLCEVVNHSDEVVECRFELELAGNVVDVVPLKLQANETWKQVMEKVSAEGGLLQANLTIDDALSVDNSAIAILPARTMVPVTLVTPTPNLYLEKVLEANPLVQLSVTPTLPEKVDAGTVLVLHQSVPPVLPDGPVYVIDPTTSCDLWDAGEVLQNPIITDQEKDSPLMTHVRLDNVFLPEARQLTFKEGTNATVVAKSVTSDPLLASITRPSGKVVVLSVQLEKGDLPFRTSFPILTSNVLNWFADEKGELREAESTGNVVEVELPSSGAWQLKKPDGSIQALPASVNTVSVGPLDQCGVWTVESAEGEVTRSIACNLSNIQESDLRPIDELPKADEAASSMVSFFDRPLWFYLLALGAAMLIVEWYLYQRRWIS